MACRYQKVGFRKGSKNKPIYVGTVSHLFIFNHCTSGSSRGCVRQCGNSCAPNTSGRRMKRWEFRTTSSWGREGVEFHLPPKWRRNTSARWCFQIFFIFTPTWGNDPIWLILFSNGLKPPTSQFSMIFPATLSFTREARHYRLCYLRYLCSCPSAESNWLLVFVHVFSRETSENCECGRGCCHVGLGYSYPE